MGSGLGPSPVSLRGGERVGGEEAAGDEFLGELNLAGGEVGGGGLGEGAIKELIIVELVSDLGEAVGRKDGNGEGEAVLWVIVGFWNHRRQALAKLDLSLKTGDAEVLGDMEIIKQHLFQGGLLFIRGVVAVPAQFIQHFLGGGLGIVSLAEPIENQQKLLLHLGGCTQLAEGGRVEKFLEVFLGVFYSTELSHALGGSHGVEHQVVVRSHVVSTPKQVDIWIVVMLNQERHGNRRRRLNRGDAKPNGGKQEKAHPPRLMEAAGTESR